MLRRAVMLLVLIVMGSGLAACDSLRNNTQPVPTQHPPKPTQIHLTPIETETSTPLPIQETSTLPPTDVSELGPDEYSLIETESMNRTEGIVYGTLSLRIPLTEQEHFEDVQLISFAAGRFDTWIGGAYYLFFPKDILLEDPVKVSMTYTEEALAYYQDRYPDFVESELTISTYSEIFDQFFCFESEYDPSLNHLSTEIYEFESEQFSLSIIEKSRCQTPQRLNLDSCEDQVVPEGAYLTERQYWINLCHQKRAIQMEDIQICENIKELSSTQTNVVSKDVCKSKVIVLSDNGSVEICNQLTEIEPFEKCIHHFAILSKDTALCDRISSESSRAYCYREVAIARLEVEICLMSDDIDVDFCIEGIAVEMSDPTMCAMISEELPSIRGDCYYKLALKLKRPDLCEFVSPPFSEQFKAICIESAQ
jgi:hypothetical protein